MNNQRCVLVEFLNEEKIATGYEVWLSNKDQQEIDQIIIEKREIIISWPNCEITSSIKAMEKLLKTAHLKKYVVCILKKGSWVEVQDAEKNLAEAGVLEITRSQRKLRHRKCLADESYEENKEKNTEKKEKAKRKINKRKVNINLLNEIMEHSQTDTSNDLSNDGPNNGGDDNVDFESSISNTAKPSNATKKSHNISNKSKTVYQSKHIKNDGSTESDSDEDMFIARSTEEARDSMISPIDLTQMDKISKIKILPQKSNQQKAGKMLMENNIEQDKMIASTDFSSDNSHDDDNYNVTPETSISNTAGFTSAINKSKRANLHQPKRAEVDSSTESEVEEDKEKLDVNNAQNFNEVKDSKYLTKGNKSLQRSKRCSPEQENDATTSESDKPIKAKKEKIDKIELDESGIFVSKCGLKRCSRRSVKAFTSDVLSVVFDDDTELAVSSITGKSSNFTKDKPAKPKLDSKRLNAVEYYILTRVPGGYSIDNVSAFKSAVRDKMNNCAKKLKYQKQEHQ